MSQGLLEHARQNRAFADCKSALREVGCDVCDVDDMDDVAKKIRNELCAGPQAVINAVLASGPGIKVTPIDRKGYKISANDGAIITRDLGKEFPAGTTIAKVLYAILNDVIPTATKEASAAPAIVDLEFIRAPYDGIDYYDNKAFGREGSGQKNGLHPGEWYLKVTTFAQREPIYASLGAFIADIKDCFMKDVRHMVGHMIDSAMQNHKESSYHHSDVILGPGSCPPIDIDPGFLVPPCRPHHPHHDPGFLVPPCRPHHPHHDHGFGGFDPDEGFNVTPEEPTTPEEPSEPIVIEQPNDPNIPDIIEGTGDCPICDKDDTFGGFEGDDKFGIDSDEETINDIINKLKA